MSLFIGLYSPNSLYVIALLEKEKPIKGGDWLLSNALNNPEFSAMGTMIQVDLIIRR